MVSARRMAKTVFITRAARAGRHRRHLRRAAQRSSRSSSARRSAASKRSGEHLLAIDDDGARRRALRLSQVAAWRVLDVDGLLVARVGEVRGEVRGVDEILRGTRLTLVERHDHVRARAILRVEPEVVRLRDLQRERVVVGRALADEELPCRCARRRRGTARADRPPFGPFVAPAAHARRAGAPLASITSRGALFFASRAAASIVGERRRRADALAARPRRLRLARRPARGAPRRSCRRA